MILQSMGVHYKFLLLVSLLAFSYGVSAQMIYPNKFFGAREYGSGRDVWSIQQANDGRLYFGTSSTLARFDGERWEHSAIPGDNTIYSIGISNDDQRVFIGAGGRFGYFDEALTYHPLSEQLPDSVADFGTIWNIVVSPDGVYFRATKYIFRFQNERLEVIHGVGDSERPFDLIALVDGTLFTHIRGVGLAKIVGSQLVLLDGLGFDLKTNAYLPHPEGILIASRYDGLFLYDGAHIRPFISEADELFKAHHIYQGIILRDGKYAFATLGGGVVIIDARGQIVHQIDSKSYKLVNESVNCIFEDTNQGLWLGMPSGLMYVDRKKPIAHYMFEVLEGYADFALYEDRLYFGTDKGLFSSNIDGSDLRHVKGSSGLCARILVANGKLFASNFDLGITYEIQSHVAHQILDGTGWAIARTQDVGNEYIAKIHEGVYRIRDEGGKWSVVKPLEEIPYNVVSIQAYQGGVIGYSISAGLFRYDYQQGLHNYNMPRIQHIGRWENEFIITGDQEFYRVHPENQELESFSALNSLLPQAYSKLHGVYQAGDTTWLLYFQHRLLTGDVYVSGKHHRKLPLFDVAQGDNSLVLQYEGKLYIGSKETIILYDLHAAEGSADALDARIKSPTISNGEINYTTGPIRFDFSVNHTSAFGDNLYRYQLLGYSEEWSEWSDQNYLQLINLTEGDYQLNLETLTPYRDQVQASTSFRVLPPWFRTIWAYIVYAVIVLGVIWLYLSYAARRLRMKNLIILKNKETKQLKETQEQRSMFFANISHELRTPLTLALGNVDLLSKDNRDKEQLQKLDNSKRNLKQLSGMVEDLLDLSKLELKQQSLHKTGVYMNPFLSRIAASFQSMAENQQITMWFEDRSESASYVELEERAFEKVINNLLYNAFKFTKADGEVILWLDIKGHQVFVGVKDNGAGISQEDQCHIFDRFYQAENHFSDGKEKGSGLGLAIAWEIVDRHGGQIEVKSEPGLGSEFIIRLDRTDPIAEDLAEFSTDQYLKEKLLKWEVNKPSILLVEDNVEMQDYLRQILEPAFKLSVASDGSEALQLLASDQPSLIISDIMMPNMDGMEFLKEVKKKPTYASLPFILLTAKNSHEDRLQGLRLGVDDYIAKPFDREELLVKLANLLDNLEQRLKWENETKDEPTGSVLVISPEDEQMINTLRTYIEAHITNSKLSVAEIADAVSMSDRQLLRKTTELCGMTPTQFIKEVRLQYARWRLMSGEIVKLSQLAIEVGIGTPAYLSRLFFERFGKKATDYIN